LFYISESLVGVLGPRQVTQLNFTAKASNARDAAHPRMAAGATLSGSGAPSTLNPAQQELLREQLPIVRRIARRMSKRLPPCVELDDLVSAGTVGLIDALSRFNPEQRVDFRLYARFRIQGAMLDSLRALDWSPRPLRRKAREVEEAISALTGRLRRAPQEDEIATEMGLSLAEYQHLLGELDGLEIGTLNLERYKNAEDEELDFVSSRPEDDPLFLCLKGELKNRLSEVIENLPERERLVITLYYYEEMTLREIGMTLGVGQSRASQMHASAVLHMRATLNGRAVRRRGDQKRRCRSACDPAMSN